MAWEEVDFVEGVLACCGYNQAEAERQAAARERFRESDLTHGPEFEAALDATDPMPPLWQQISQIPTRRENQMDPAERRAGIRRLLRVVERMFRKEIASADVDADGAASRLDGGEASYAGRSLVWDPLHEICLYLGIAKSKLDALSLHRTGLRAGEICDCIRVEGLRAVLREKFRGLMKAWNEREAARGLVGHESDLDDAWRFLKWMRGGGRCESRKKLALQMGMRSRERLDRAVMVGSRETLEELEIAVALEVIAEADAPARTVRVEVEVGSHGAGFDGVVRESGLGGEVSGEVGRESA